jgi:hypothetical protein
LLQPTGVKVQNIQISVCKLKNVLSLLLLNHSIERHGNKYGMTENKKVNL